LRNPASPRGVVQRWFHANAGRSSGVKKRRIGRSTGAGIIVPMRYQVEQAQLLLQGTYHFETAPPAPLK
jgi:hypothetical protein